MKISLEGRVALVTGGSRGIGRAIAESFAESGAAVIVAARGREALDEAQAAIERRGGAGVLAVPCDVSDAASVTGLFEAAMSRFGRVDILVNNAGSSARGRFGAIDDQAWQADLDLKLFAAIRLARLALPGMSARRWGRILNMLSIIGKAPGAASAPTSVSRAAGLALTKVLAAEFAPANILVNAICVGWIESDQWPRFHQREAPGIPYDDYVARKGSEVPLGRLGSAEEVAGLACFLASDAGGYVTGTAINVDGGRSPVP